MPRVLRSRRSMSSRGRTLCCVSRRRRHRRGAGRCSRVCAAFGHPTARASESASCSIQALASFSVLLSRPGNELGWGGLYLYFIYVLGSGAGRGSRGEKLHDLDWMMRSSVRRMKAKGARLGRRRRLNVPLLAVTRRSEARRGEASASRVSHLTRVQICNNKLCDGYIYISATNFANLRSQAAIASFFCSSDRMVY